MRNVQPVPANPYLVSSDDNGTLADFLRATGMQHDVAEALAQRFGNDMARFRDESTPGKLDKIHALLELKGVNHNVGEFHEFKDKIKRQALRAYNLANNIQENLNMLSCINPFIVNATIPPRPLYSEKLDLIENKRQEIKRLVDQLKEKSDRNVDWPYVWNMLTDLQNQTTTILKNYQRLQYEEGVQKAVSLWDRIQTQVLEAYQAQRFTPLCHYENKVM